MPLSDGQKKEIYRDVRFFHGALQLTVFHSSEFVHNHTFNRLNRSLLHALNLLCYKGTSLPVTVGTSLPDAELTVKKQFGETNNWLHMC